MILPSTIAALKAIARDGGLEVREDEPMGPHTTYKTGGPADLFLSFTSPAAVGPALDVLAEGEIVWTVIGNGSNVLFGDGGFRGAVLHLTSGFDRVDLQRDALGEGHHLLEVGAGLSITRLLRVTKDQNLQGLECLGGVPGTIGGAVRMNAGTVMGELKDSLVAAEVRVAGQGSRWIPAAELGLSYRKSQLPEGALVLAARFACTDATPQMRERLAEVLAYRKSTQPLTMPSCGSVFANPPGDAAGRLIDVSGLKGRTIGGAQVSEKHANWIVNTGEARPSDIRALIELCVAEVQRQHGVTLRPEVQLLGEWEVSA